MPLSYPNPVKIVTSDDLGITAAQSVPFTHTFTEFAQLLYVTIIYLADATVITRQPGCAISTPGGQLAWNMISQSAITASQLEQVYWPQGEGAQGFLFSVLPNRLAPRFYVFPGYTMTFSSLSSGPGDLQTVYFSTQIF